MAFLFQMGEGGEFFENIFAEKEPFSFGWIDQLGLFFSAPVWSELAKFNLFGNIFNVLDNFLRDYLVFGKTLNLIWQNY